MRQMPVQQRDGVIDHASHGYRVAALKLDQQHAAETTVSCSAKQEPSPTNHKQEIA